MRQDLIDIVASAAHEQLDQPTSLGLDDELAAAGFESLRLVALISSLESRLGIEFPAELIHPRTFRTIRSITAAVQELSPR